MQEVLADGVSSVGNFYYASHKDYPAAMSRYREVDDEVSGLFAECRRRLFSLAEALQHTVTKRKRRSTIRGSSSSIRFRIVWPTAKERLTALNQPIPHPNPVALARAQQQSRVEPSGVLARCS